MKRQFILTDAPINEPALVAQRSRSPELGAAAYFAGVVRGIENGAPIRALEYEAFARMAEHQVDGLFQEVARRWPVASVRLVHRVGVVPAGETALWVEVIAPRRAEAFAACQWVIDEFKQIAPIWKRPCPQPPPRAETPGSKESTHDET